MAIYNGTSGNDSYSGGNANDIIFGNGGNDTLYGGGGNDQIDGGSGNDQIDGGNGLDTINGGPGADLVQGGAGNDAMVYRRADNSGVSDTYSGGTGIDKIILDLTSSEWLAAAMQSEVSRYVSHLATVARNPRGEVAAGSIRDFTFNFGSATLKASAAEALEIRVDGVLIDYHAPTIRLADQVGTVTEDDSAPLLNGSGEISFYDINYANSHTATALPVPGNTLGGTMTATVTDQATGDGQGKVSWTYEVANEATQFLAEGQTVTEQFNVSITDNTGRRATRLVTVTVTGTNDGPVATSSVIATNEDQAIWGKIGVIDPDTIDSLTYSIAVSPAHGTLQFGVDGSYIYTPTPGFTGDDIFTYRIVDSQGASTSAAAIISVAPGGAPQVIYLDRVIADDLVSPPIRNAYDPPEVAALTDGGHVVVWTASDSSNPDTSGFGVYQQRYDAAGLKVGSPQLVNSTTHNHQREASVAALGDGWVVTWAYYRQGDPNDDGIFAQRYNADGSRAGGEMMVSETISYSSKNYSDVSELANGGCVITWIGLNEHDNLYDIYARIYDSNGVAQTGEFIVNSTLGDNESNFGIWTESVVGLAGGRFMVVWIGIDSAGLSVFGRLFDSGGSAVADQFRVNTTFEGDHYHASVGAVGAGFVVTWGGADGSSSGIYAQRYDDNGNALGEEFQVNSWTSDTQLGSKVVELADGGFVIIWHSFGVAVNGSYDIAGQRYDASGNVVGGEFIVNSHRTIGFTDNATFPSVTLREDGALVVAWVDDDTNTIAQKVIQSFDTDVTPLFPVPDDPVSPPINNNDFPPEVAVLADGGNVVVWAATGASNPDNSGDGVYLQRYDAAGSRIGDPQLVNTTTSGQQDFPCVAATSDGWVVSWSDSSQDGSNYGIFAQRFSADGSRVGGEVLINQNTTDLQIESNVGELANGGYVISWSDNSDSGSFDVYARVYDANGVAQTDEFIVNTHTLADQLNGGFSTESVIGLEGGGFVVTWIDYGGLDGAGRGIYARLFHADGSAVGDQFQVNSSTEGDQYNASVSAVGSGFVVTWAGPDDNGDGIYAQRYDANGTAVGAEFAVNSRITSQQWNPSVSELSDGGFVIAWQSFGLAGSAYSIAGQRYDAAGNAVNGEFIISNLNPIGADQSDVAPSIALRNDGALVAVWQNSATLAIEQKIITSFGAGSAEAKDLIGGMGNDSFIGSGFADTLVGVDGDDRLDGLSGSDQLSGGDGNDTYVFSTNPGVDNVDAIWDFTSGSDTIWLSNGIGSPFSNLPSGPLDAGALDIMGDGNAASADTRIIYDPNTGALYFDADGDGGAAAVLFATLIGMPSTIVANDIVIGA